MSFLSSILAEAKGIHNDLNSKKPVNTSSTTQVPNPVLAHPLVAAQRNATTATSRVAAIPPRHRTHSGAVGGGRSARPMAKMRPSRFSYSTQYARAASKDTPPGMNPLLPRSPSIHHYNNRSNGPTRVTWNSSTYLNNKDSLEDRPLPKERTSPSPSPIYQPPSPEHEPTFTRPADPELSHHSKSTDLFNISPIVEQGLIMAVHKPERRPARLQKSLYIPMKRQQLLEEAQFRGLEIVDDNKGCLIEMLVINDEAYFELIQKLGDRYIAEEFAKGAVEQYHRELEHKGPVVKPAITETAAKMEDVSTKRKWEYSQSNDPGYSTASLPNKGGNGEEQPKPKKRPRSRNNGENTTRKKKAKSSSAEEGPHLHVQVPRIIQNDSDSFHTNYTSEMDSEMSGYDQLFRLTEPETDPLLNASTPNEDTGMSASDKESEKGTEIQKPVHTPTDGKKYVQNGLKPGVAIVINGPRKPRSAASTATARDRMNVKRFLKF